jgi:hypothetical protein
LNLVVEWQANLGKKLLSGETPKAKGPLLADINSSRLRRKVTHDHRD